MTLRASTGRFKGLASSTYDDSRLVRQSSFNQMIYGNIHMYVCLVLVLLSNTTVFKKMYRVGVISINSLFHLIGI